MVPEEAVQVTAVLVAVPWTVAEKKSVALTARVAEAGETVTEFTTGFDGGGLDGGGLDEVGGGFDVGATPVAERVTTVGVSLALLTRARLPVTVPVRSGSESDGKSFRGAGGESGGQLETGQTEAAAGDGDLMNGERAGAGVAGGDGLRRAAADRSGDGDGIRRDGEFCVRRGRRGARVRADSADATSELKGHSDEAEYEHEERASVRTWKIQRRFFLTLLDFCFDPSRPRVSRLTKQKRTECGCYGSLGNAYYLYRGQFVDT